MAQRPLDWLNYQHLLYFWTASHSDTLAEAALKLHLTSPTISAQIRKLETAIGHELLVPSGRTLELTEVGHLVQQYADEIFGLGAELSEALAGRTPGGEMALRVGISDAIPKLMVYGLFAPILQDMPNIRLQCDEADTSRLIERLVSHQLDVVIADARIGDARGKRVFHHLLGESGTSFLAAPNLVEELHTLAADDPGALASALASEATFLLPRYNAALRRQLDEHFAQLDLYPKITHEFEDTALMKVFGEAGIGIFPAPMAIEERICSQYHVRCIARAPEIRECFYAITAERHIRHPAVERLTQHCGNAEE